MNRSFWLDGVRAPLTAFRLRRRKAIQRYAGAPTRRRISTFEILEARLALSTTAGIQGDHKTSVYYDAATGAVGIQPDSHPIGLFQILSASGIFRGTTNFPPGGLSFVQVNTANEKAWLAQDAAASAISNDFYLGNIAAPGLTQAFLLGDLTLTYSGGIGTDNVAGDLVYISGANQNPVFTSPAMASVPENTIGVMTVTATDVQTLTYSIVDGADQSKFGITANGVLSFLLPPDFEAPTDDNGDNVYVVSVQASDGEGGMATQTINVNVTPVNESSPVFSSPDAAIVPENTTDVLMVNATDADLPAPTITYSIIAGADQSKFSITPGGVLSFSTPPNFASPTDSNGDNVYVVVVQASDGSLTSVQAILVTVTTSNQYSPVFTSANTANVPENSAAVLTVTATDADVPPQIVTYSIVGGADQAKFSITAVGALSFISAPDFEAPSDANGDNTYVVTVQASDGEGGMATQAISVSVTPVNEFNPILTSPNYASVPENTTAVMTVTATDADLPAQAATFSIFGGADQDKFSITSGGSLSLKSPPDFEAPDDASGDNLYVVIVEASDGSLSSVQSIFVTVTPVNEFNPTFSSSNTASVPENTTAVLTVMASDADLPAQVVTLSIVGGADQAKFSIAADGALSFISAPDFEGPSDANGDNVYLVEVQASDGQGGEFTQSISVTVTPVNEFDPVITSADGVNVEENTIGVLTLTATDADLPLQSLSFAIMGGADQAKFTLTGGGALSFATPPDFEMPTDSNGDNVYVIIVQASDGSRAGFQAILITVTDAFEGLAGDYNLDGAVDSADYVLWRNSLNTAVPPYSGADGNGDGVVDEADNEVWRANFGRSALAAASTSSLTVAPAEIVGVARHDGGGTPSLGDILTQTDTLRLSRSSGVVDSAKPIARPGRPTRSATWPIAASHDAALVAWLASRADLKLSTVLAGTPSQVATEEHVEPSIKELDLAFTAI